MGGRAGGGAGRGMKVAGGSTSPYRTSKSAKNINARYKLSQKYPRPEGLSTNPSVQLANDVAAGQIKFNQNNILNGTTTSQNSVVNNVNVGPSVTFHFTSSASGKKSSYTMYGNPKNIKDWASKFFK
jgi:hypothetical protein